ncbi:PAS domain-containing sensor histidine kinase [uncultured Methylovirgula sp.]|uniref:sensor histidine kinase NtrY-like n=1 Tax=uncultured Methylovirgula sp. TaxID=1285960 RepID=UPI0026029BC4|nr:PAS domain-containing sensor histidine kinase [uncultured Methylovirgula sp.]
MSEATHALEPNAPRKTPRRQILGRAAVVLAIVAALTSFLIFAGYVPQIPPTDNVVVTLFVINLVCILVLVGFVMVEAWTIIAARRRQAAGARLHLRIVGLFSAIAIVPAILMAFVGSVTLDRSLNPVFLRDVRGFILRTGEAARFFQEGQCRVLLREAQLTASDLDSGESMFKSDRQLFHKFFASRVEALGFGAAAMIHPDGKIDDKVVAAGRDGAPIVQPKPNDFNDARASEPLCMILDEGRTFVALRKLDGFGGDAFLYVARPVGPFGVEFARQATRLITFYDMFDAYRHRIQIAFATMYVLIALVMLLAATWVGLSFANSLVAPIRRLITAADEVGSGNLDVHVAVNPSEGDLSHLGETFNKMTSEIRLQQNRLIAASALIDERRLFTEAVLSGVPVAVIGVGGNGRITVVNPSAERLIPHEDGQGPVGQPIDAVLPEVMPVLEDARNSSGRLSRGQISVNRGGRERTFNLLVTTEPGGRTEKNFVVTLDDITDLVTAQRTAAWADVARRIAHEIKNPLTPIQLSAERLKRKYGRLVVDDRDIFDQCIDTIVRQVDDIKRMVDEFSAFARMPRARLVPDDVTECLRHVIFLMRVGHPDIEFADDLPQEPVIADFDRRLLSQAVANITKNATEGIAAQAEIEPPLKGRISISLDVTPEGLVEIFVADNGKGFPKENRHRLLEPYMTTRAEGTGLGLPIVAKILEDHGGGIELLDAPGGRGACVRLYFPKGDTAHRAVESSEEKRSTAVVESAK